MVWRGLAVGILISAPMGPVGILCIQRTLDRGRKAGLSTGIGAAISDLFYCLLTGFGLSFIEDFLQENSNVIQLFGSLVLIAFSIYLFKKNPSSSLRRPVPQNVSVKKNILGGFLFTFSNPLIIFLIIGLFARFNFTSPEIEGGFYAIGYVFIIVGALIWWYGVTYLIDKVRTRFNMRSMKRMNIAIGIVILAFATVGIVTSIIGLTSGEAQAAGSVHSMPVSGARNVTCRLSLTTVETGNGYELEARADEPVDEGVAGRIELVSDIILEKLPPAGVRDIDMKNITDWRLEFRLADIHSHPDKRYSYKDQAGKVGKVRSPGWKLLLNDGEERVEIKFLFDEHDGNPLSTERVMIAEISRMGDFFYKGVIAGGIDTGDGWNLFQIDYSPAGGLVIKAGNHGLGAGLRVEGSEGIMGNLRNAAVLPGTGGRLRLKYPSLTLPYSPSARMSEMPVDEIEERLRLSNDAAEGEWQILDYSLENTKVRLGGNYRMAVVRNSEGKYEMVYLSGATVNGGSWKQGMLKGILMPTGLDGIYECEWRDCNGRTLPMSVKAQIDGRVMTVHLPQSDSRLRLCRADRGK
ncbi:MAG: LysE family translocator [Muribaculaceae bacterium]|nr:LysE family translocator [Muribaculaceae bacterium]